MNATGLVLHVPGSGKAALLNPTHRWSCPNCGGFDVTHELRPHTRMHTCPGLRGLTAPMVPAGTKCKVEAVERGDYLGDDARWVTRDGEGRPIMSVITTRDDGMDCAVFAPTATIERDVVRELRADAEKEGLVRR